jgi:hypothetical protein
MTDVALRIFCVLKTGRAVGQQPANKVSEYLPEHVQRLRDQVEKHHTYAGPYEFICLSDAEIDGVDVIPLRHGWPGWWSKMELYRPEIQAEHNVYLDLDTTVRKDITDMLEHPHTFTVLNNLSSPEKRRIGSGILAWGRGYECGLYETFAKNPKTHMQQYVTARRWGDQGFLQDHVKSWDYWQVLFPGKIASYKIGTSEEKEEAAIICFHGKPKPWEVE